MNKFFSILLFSCLSVFAQNEITINSFTKNAQREPIITRLDITDEIVIVWKSENQVDSASAGDIYMQFLDKNMQPFRGEILVNDSTIGDQKNPQIASNKNGDFIIVWSSFENNNSQNIYDIKAKFFPIEQSFISDEFIVNSYRINSQIKPQVAINDNREFIIVWESWFQDGSDRGIYAQRFNYLMEKIGSEFLVNTTTQFSQAKPVVKYYNDGRFIITWESWNEAEKGYNLFAKVYDKDGNVLKDEFLINSYTDNYQWFADISISSKNIIDLVWCSWEQDGYDGGIYLRSFDENYNPIGEEILVNSSTEFYQWLPKIKRFEDDKKVIVWSSWNLDGSREGVYYKIFNDQNKPITLDARLNETTESYQWEPNIITLPTNEILAVWSSWNGVSDDYDVIAKNEMPKYLVGTINSSKYNHSNGNSTSDFIVHVIDSTKLTGDDYEISFAKFNNDFLDFSIIDLTTNKIKIDNYPLNLGQNVQYLTEEFDGIIVELKPNFELAMDYEKSKFINNSGSNLNYEIEKPVISPTTAPIDIAVVWGSTDTLSYGNYVTALDTAVNQENVKEIILPFYTENVLTEEKLDLLVLENKNTINKKWDAGETIVFLTPEPYKTNLFSTHAQLISFTASENIVLPNIGDTNYIYTKKPLTENDVFQFTTNSSNIILGIKEYPIDNSYILFQNYPNPFNPTTTIKYSLTSLGKGSISSVKLVVYDLLGGEIKTLVNEFQKPGNYQITFDASSLSSGIYFYKLQINDNSLVKKMMLLK
ncbi:MAG: T9SS type A sorting domain-containing protein [Ignavibacteriales bacterium]|nr:T9SS type A sorting domain-containing protein [Ignavibacteriales bacterium]